MPRTSNSLPDWLTALLRNQLPTSKTKLETPLADRVPSTDDVNSGLVPLQSNNIDLIVLNYVDSRMVNIPQVNKPYKNMKSNYDGNYVKPSEKDNFSMGKITDEKSNKVKDRLEKYKEQVKMREDNGEFFCHVCRVDCGSAELLLEHKEGPGFVCRICTVEISNHNELESHFETHLIFNCNICKDVFFSRGDLLEHQEKNHAHEKPYKCNLCDAAFFRSRPLHKHKLKNHNSSNNRDKSFKCELCEKSYEVQHMLKHHYWDAHSAYEYMECKYCQKLILGPLKLKKHIRSLHVDSDSNRPASCFTCGKVFKRLSTLVSHQKEYHESENNVCEFCGQKFNTRYQIKAHIEKEHPKTGTFVCKICNEKFTTDLLLRTHKRSHRARNESGPVFCEICGKLFKTAVILKHHKLIHSGEKPFKCDVCNATFRQQVCLKTHSRVHSDVGLYNCVNCGKNFKWKQTFDKHVKICRSEIDVDESNSG